MAGNTKSNAVRNAELNEIRRLLGDFNSDELIMAHLKLPEATYYRYKKRIEKEDTKILEKEDYNTVKHQIKMLDRALDYVIQVNREICEDENTSASERRESSIVIAKAYTAKLESRTKGPNSPTVRVIAKQLVKDDQPRLTQH